MSDNSMANKSDKAPEKAADNSSEIPEFMNDHFMLMMIIFEDTNPGFPVKNWERHAARAGISVATAKQRWAKARDAYLERMKNHDPATPVIKSRKKRARASPGEDVEVTPASKKSKRDPKSSPSEIIESIEHDNSHDNSPARPVAKGVGKTAVKGRKGRTVAAPASAPVAAPITAPVASSVGRSRKSTRRSLPGPKKDDVVDDEYDVPSEGHVPARPLLFPNLHLRSQQQPATHGQDKSSQNDVEGQQEKEKDQDGSSNAKKKKSAPLPTLEDKRRQLEEKDVERRHKEEEVEVEEVEEGDEDDDDDEEEKRQAALGLLALRFGRFSHCRG
ncbi:ribosomal protein S10p/S20e [Apiospora arundinis]